MNPILGIVVLLAAAASTSGQAQDPQETKKKLMDQVRERLAEERRRILDRVGKLIDEELDKRGGGGEPIGVAELIERRREQLQRDIEERQGAIRELELWKEDIALIEEVRKEKPAATREEVNAAFQAAYQLLAEDKDYAAGNRAFKKLFYAYREVPEFFGTAVISAYNIACGYSLLGGDPNITRSLDWLEVSLRLGYAARTGGCENGCQYDREPHSSFEHMELDTDLENIRTTERWKELVKRFKPR
jgi:hypothetical protein